MINKIIKNAVCMLSAFFLMFSTNSLLADNYPSKPITMVIPYGPGGLADVSARILAGTLPTHIGQTILAINKAGAAGVIGSTFVKGSKPDGYTLLLARVGSQMGVPAMNKTIPYKWDDFTIIGMLETNPFVLVVPSSSDIKNFKEFEKKNKIRNTYDLWIDWCWYIVTYSNCCYGRYYGCKKRISNTRSI